MVSTTTTSNATATNETLPDMSIAPFATALNGVNQTMNMVFRDAIWWGLGVLAMAILTIRLTQRAMAHWRHMSAMGLSADQQAYWAKHTRSIFWKFKKYILYAPLGRKRHNREIKLSKAGNMGTMPSRFHSILIAIFILSNLAFCCVLNYGRPNKWSIIAELRGRTGVLAVVNMIALVIFAGRNNPLIPLLQISFDTYNLMHRWIGRMVVLEVVIHTICWAVVKHAATGWSGMWEMMVDDPFIGWGTVGTVAMVILVIQSFSPIRHAFYEVFLNVHIILAFVAILGTWIHCRVANLPMTTWVEALFILWVLERCIRFARILWFNYSRKEGWTKATIQALPGDACRVTLRLPKQATIKPGSHAYLRFGSVKLWDSHPFSIAWVEDKPRNPVLPYSEKGDSQKPQDTDLVSDVSFIIQAQTGMTRTLFEKAYASHGKTINTRAAFEGPYGGHHSLDSYGHVVLFAGSSGITHQIPYVQHLIQGFNDGTVATRKITLVWITRETESLEWVRPWMDTILHMPRRREILNIKLFVTRPQNARQIVSQSTTVQMTPGRPNVDLLMEKEMESQKGAMCVTVCGPGGLADNVRGAVRKAQHRGVVDFIEESFTW
ncbi:putative ferric reductase transmembrane component 3 [Halenospora varia]|nr:putative ferric reductase transmembrane component 3 [Halenospora varia]